MRNHYFVSLAIAATLATGCLTEREGPSSDDNGSTLFWELHQFDTIYDGCSDAPDSVVRVETPEFERNSFFIYELSSDGTEATSQDCTSTDASTCSPQQPPLVLMREEGNEYVWDPTEVAVGAGGAGCEVLNDERWVFTDEGEVGTLDLSLTFNLLGDSCAELDQQFQEEAPNGEGVDGCTVTVRAELDHFLTD